MAKVFYVISYDDTADVNFFKTEKEALEYGKKEFPEFKMDGKSAESEDDYTYIGDSLTFKKGILFSYGEDGVKIQAMEDEAARQYAEDLEDMGSAVFFDGFSKGMYADLGRDITGKNIKWSWTGDGIRENETKSSLKHVQLFEQFLSNQK